MPDERTLLALDYGTLRIGVAFGSTFLRHARPIEIIATPVKAKRFARLEELLVQWQPDALVVGVATDPRGWRAARHTAGASVRSPARGAVWFAGHVSR